MTVRAYLKTKVAETICHPAMGRLLSQVLRDRIPCRGCVIDTSCALVNPEVKALLFWRLYESAEMRFVNQYLRRDLDVIELGSSLGVIACQIRRRINESSKLVCVEAIPELADQIDVNLNINALNKGVSIVRKAIDYGSPRGHTISFARGKSTIAGKIACRQDQGGHLIIETTTLSQVIGEHGIGDYVLVSDIEGAEAGIALQEKSALRNCKQIIIELHPTNFNDLEIDADQMCEIFINVHGFTLRDRYGPVCVFEKQLIAVQSAEAA